MTTPPGSWPSSGRWPCTARPCGLATPRGSASSAARPCSAPPAPRGPRRRQRTRAGLARKLASPLGMDDWVRVRLGVVGGTMVATPLPRGAGVLTSLVRADGLLVVPAGREGHHPGEEVEIELLRSLDEISRTIVAIGSPGPLLDPAAPPPPAHA